MSSQKPARTFQTAVSRWAGLGPYYAMFPVDFAFNVVERYTRSGDAILDPFAGRASSIFAAHAQGRTGSGIEINPVGWLYGTIKMNPASEERVLARLAEIGFLSVRVADDELSALPEFFHLCYSKNVLRFLVTARRLLEWRNSRVDGTLMANILVYLHGKAPYSLSNQMRQGKAMAPDYCVKWWKENNTKPPDIDPVTFLKKRVVWRYAKGKPKFNPNAVIFGDSTKKISYLRRKEPVKAGFKLLFTSPPYHSVTNYHYDQWLRLWVMGGTERPTYRQGRWEKRFDSMEGYKLLLELVFCASKKLLADDAILYIRTDARDFTLQTTTDVLANVFPHKELQTVACPTTKLSQTALFGDKLPKPGEVDLILG